MNRLLHLLILGAACAVAAAACGDNGDHVSITLFEAAPDAVEVGSATRLLFAVDPPGAEITIDSVGELTGQKEITVRPSATTVYQLTARSGDATAQATVTVTVGPRTGNELRLAAATQTPTAGEPFAVTVSMLAGDGSPATGYRGTVHLASSDAAAVLPGDVTFTAADAGVKQVMVTLKTAGFDTVSGADTARPGLQGSAALAVRPAAASVLQLAALPATAEAGQPLSLAITARDAFGNLATGYAGSVALTSTDPTDVLPAAGGFTAGVRVVSLSFVKAGTHFATVAEVAGGIAAVDTTSVVVGAAPPFRIDVSPASASMVAGTTQAVTVTLLDRHGNTATGYTGTVHFASDDPSAQLPADYAFTAADAGVHAFSVTLKTAGTESVTVSDTIRPVAGSAAIAVQHAPASVFQLAALPTTAEAGQPLSLAISARDAFGNLATSYAGAAAITSTDPTDVLPAAGGFTAGVRVVSLSFVKVGAHFATVSEVAGGITAVDTTSVAIGAAPPSRIEVSATSATTIAGAAEPFTVKLLDRHGNTATGYRGTVHFASDDLNALVPADYTFTAADAGVHAFSVSLKTAGVETLTATDAAAALTGSAAWRVGAAAAASCTISQAPASATAGAVVGLTVEMHDAFGNVATSYAGTVRLTATDVLAALPPDATYVPLLDDGRHAFSTALFTAGSHTVTATDIDAGALQCTAAITITPAAPILVVGLPANANAGYPVVVGVTVKDVFDNAISGFAGTVSFTSSDTGAGAVAPAPITFTGSEGGVGSTSATFVTLGNQVVGATGGAAANGSALCAVHGLVYTAPTTGRVRLVANAAASNTQIIQLDLIANERLERSGFFGGGPGSFTVGMNLPLDTTRVTGDTTLFTPSAVLPAGTGTRAAAGRIGSNSVLYTVVSRKRDATSNFTQSTEVLAGQAFYSVRLKLLPNGTVGPVFDGAQPSPLFRAAVRDQFGDDFVNQGDFGLGRLEIR